MSFNYKFTNLLGTVYHKGNLLFTPDGQTLISPVGNRITFYDLRSNKSETLPIESRYNFITLALSPDGISLIAVNEVGEALWCSLISRRVLHKFHFRRPIRDVKFSPNGKYFAVTKENNVFLYLAPGPQTRKYNSFVLEKVFKFSYDETTCMDWTSDSRILAVGACDMTTKIYAVENLKNFSVCTLGSHTDTVIGCFFEENSLDMYTVSKNGVLCVWESSIDLESLVAQGAEEEEKEKGDTDDEEDDVDDKKEEVSVPEKKQGKKTYYKKIEKHHIRDAVKKEGGGYVSLTAAAYQKKIHLFVAGFSNGAFLLYEMPNCNLIHSLSISSQAIQSIAFNSSGDWIALGCSGVGQLVVWEWQSESFALKQQGHFNNMHCLCYSPEGMYIATGGEDGKVKLWDTTTGFCFVTFTEHGSSITGVTFLQNGRAVVSASLDGTVRAFDLKRYRNFRTFVTPHDNTQLSCLAVDSSGEIICAGSQMNFEIYVWGMPTGRLLTILAGHEAPVSGIHFSPNSCVLVSSSWDKTVRIWDVFESKGIRETINLFSDGLAIAFKPDGREFAVATLDGQISFFNAYSSEQLGCIEGKYDLHAGRREDDLITSKAMQKTKAFTTLCYSANGEYILAGGVSKFLCVYHVGERLLLNRYEVTCNLSFDAVEDFINRRRITEFGNKALIEERKDKEIDAIATPGTKKVDKSARTFKPQVMVSAVQFSPAGKSWAATTTEGLLVYSLDNNMIFAPFDPAIEITPDSIRKTLRKEEYSQAIIMAIRLNEQKVIAEVLESVPFEHIENLVGCLPLVHAERLLRFISEQISKSAHFEFYLIWVQHLVTIHGPHLKEKSLSVASIFTNLELQLLRRGEAMLHFAEQNKHELEYGITLTTFKRKAEESNEDSDDNQDMMEADASHSSSDESSDSMDS